ncbi:MAG: phosphatase PAP2 family protein [Longimicrobiales bacterium]
MNATSDVTTPAPSTLRMLLVGIVAIAAAHLVDGVAYQYFHMEGVYDEDWGRMLRVMGFVPLWLLVAMAFVLHDTPQAAIGRWARWARGALLVAGVAAAGILGELLKLFLRRERPRAHEGEYVFRSFAERPFSTGGLAWPSSHAIVAFGAAAMLSRLFPRARWVFWALAWGCGLSRVADGAHFMSDIVTAAVAAWLVIDLIWRWHARRHPAVHALLSRATDVAIPS